MRAHGESTHPIVSGLACPLEPPPAPVAHIARHTAQRTSHHTAEPIAENDLDSALDPMSKYTPRLNSADHRTVAPSPAQSLARVHTRLQCKGARCA